MKNKSLKIFIAFFTLVMLLLSLFLPYTNNSHYAAAVVVPTSTKKNKTVGHKIEGAEWYPELYGKSSVWGVPNGGGSGEGGGAGDSNASNAGNSGAYNDAGGVLGGAAGVGLGAGSNKNVSGEGASNKGGSTGSATADALRALKMQMEALKAESLAKVLETAVDASSVAASIAERESMQESIKKRLQQESIKAKIAQAETQKQYETPVYIEETERQYRSNLDLETVRPTQTQGHTFIDLDRNVKPTAGTSFYEENDTQIRPTGASEKEEVLKETLETYDSPIIPEETSEVVEEETSYPDSLVDVYEQYIPMPTEMNTDVEEGQGSKGGKDAEALEDMKGDDGENESKGNAEEKGKTQQESKGEFAGKKIFELKQNGDIGFEPEHLSILGVKRYIKGVLILLMLTGALIFVTGTRDKRKKDKYF